MLQRMRFALRKLRGGAVCLYENGWAYTWYRGWQKVGRALLRYGASGLPYREVRRKRVEAARFPPSKFIRPPSAGARTLAIFAMYKPSGIIDGSTWLYLNGLRSVADDLIVCSDSAVRKEDVERMKNIASCGVFSSHGGYDFGSYARAFLIARESGRLQGCDRLILANDSCIGPLFPLSSMMECMTGRRCDFWGQTSFSFHGRPHVQSYFMVFSRKIIENGTLDEFFASMPVCRSRAEVISSCEIALTEFLVKRGFKWESYVPYRAVLKNPTASPCALVRRYACPLVKTKALLGESFDSVNAVRDAVRKANLAVYDAFAEVSLDWEFVPPVAGRQVPP